MLPNMTNDNRLWQDTSAPNDTEQYKPGLKSMSIVQNYGHNYESGPSQN